MSSSDHSSKFSPLPSLKQITGTLGETLVAAWLEQQGWQILHRQWRCRWGELDIIAIETIRHGGVKEVQDPVLTFVEVKTRSRGNWDENGLLAMTPQKQAKLLQAAQLFLSQHPHWAEYSCRFDVALVRCESSLRKCRPNAVPSIADSQVQPFRVTLGEPIQIAHYSLTLQDYIQAAFSQE